MGTGHGPDVHQSRCAWEAPFRRAQRVSCVLNLFPTSVYSAARSAGKDTPPPPPGLTMLNGTREPTVCIAGEVRYELGFFESLVQKFLAFISALMFFLQTLYSPDAAKSYQSSARRRGGPDRGSKPSGGPRINGMSNLGSSGNGAAQVTLLLDLLQLNRSMRHDIWLMTDGFALMRAYNRRATMCGWQLRLVAHCFCTVASSVEQCALTAI